MKVGAREKTEVRGLLNKHRAEFAKSWQLCPLYGRMFTSVEIDHNIHLSLAHSPLHLSFHVSESHLSFLLSLYISSSVSHKSLSKIKFQW